MDESEESPEKIPLLEDGETPGSVRSKVKGMLAALTKVNVVVISSSCVQLLERSIPDLELNTIRLSFSLLFFIIGLIWNKEWPLVPRSEILGVVIYSVAMFGTSLSFYIAVTVLPVATVQCTSITTTIVAGIVLHRLIIPERITLVVVSSAIVCITGVTMVIQPEFFFSDDPIILNNDSYANIANNLTVLGTQDKNSLVNIVESSWKYAIPTMDGLSVVAQTIVVKKKPFLGQHVLTVLFWTMLINSIVSALLTWIFESPVLPKDWYGLLFTIIHGCSIVFIFPAAIFAVQHISGNTYNIVCSTGVISMLVAQYTVLSSILPGHRNWIEMVGVVLVLIGSTLGSIVEILKSKIDAPKDI